MNSETKWGAAGAPKQRFATRPQLWLGLLFGLGALYLAGRGLDFVQLGQVLRGVRWPFVVLALLIYLLTQVAKAIRWRWLLAGRQVSLNLSRLAGLLVIGQAVNLLLPTRLGDLMRAYMAGDEGRVSKVYVLGTIAGEKALDLVALALLVLVLVPLMALPAWLAGRVGPVVFTALAMAAGVGALLAGRRFWLAAAGRLLPRLLPRAAAAWQARLAAGLDGLAALADPKALLGVWWWTLVSWFLAALTNLVLFLAFDLPAAPRPALFLLAVLQAGVAVPSSPGKIGVFHALCMLALSAFAITGPLAMGYSLILHLLVVGGSSAWAALAFWRHGWSVRKSWALDA